jgi:hypothetical protein
MKRVLITLLLASFASGLFAQGPKAGAAHDRGGVHTWVFVAR